MLVYNVLNEQYLRTLTLKRMLLKMVVLGAFGPRISNIAVGSSYHFYFFVYIRLKREKFAGKNIIYANFYQLSPMESTGIEHPNDI